MTRADYKDMYDVVGAAMEVYNTLGRGMAEAIYQEALAVEMKKRDMVVEREKLYLPEDDDFVLLSQDNYKDYIEDRN